MIFYENDFVTLYKGDCIEIMPELKEKFDACITDPPYGTTNCKWDSIIPFEQMWQELKRIIKDNGAICLFGSEPFSSALRMSNIKMFKYDWIWDKKSAGNILCAKYQPLKRHETISVFSKKTHVYFPILKLSCKDRTKEKQSVKKSDITSVLKSGKFFKTNKNKPSNSRYPYSIIEISKQSSECCNAKSFHPTQKPVELIEYLVKTYTNENDIVLDFTAGSGTTGIACMNTNRKCVLIEKEEKYCNIIVERLKQAEKEKLENLF